jgi:hypothetical protein
LVNFNFQVISKYFHMKKYSVTLLSAALLASSAIAQTAAEKAGVQSRVDSTSRSQVIPQAGTSNSRSASVAKSDTGAQRPVKLKKSGISTFLGYDAKLVYRSNPLASAGKLKQLASGVWTHTFFGGAGLGVFDFGDSVVTPYIGGSWSSNEYTETNLQSFDYYSTGAYAVLLAQYSNGWSARAGVSYASDSSVKYKTEDYSEFYPSVGIMKAYTISSSTTAVFDATLGMHDSDIAAIDGTDQTADRLDNWDASLSYGLHHKYGNFTLSPKLTTTYKLYENGDNKDRDDWINSASLKIDYPIINDVKASLLASYTNRDSSGAEANYDYKSWDGGIGINVSTRF